MDFDYRRLEPRTRIHPALRIIVGFMGLMFLIGAAGLLFALFADESDRDWSLLIGVAAFVAFAWGCYLIAFNKFDEKESMPVKARSKRVRVLIGVACAFSIAQLAYDAYASGFTTAKTFWAALFSLLLVSIIVSNWRAKPTPGK